jgi:signal transduction histidine kinase
MSSSAQEKTSVGFSARIHPEKLWSISQLALDSWKSKEILAFMLKQICSEFDFLACFLAQPSQPIVYYCQSLALTYEEIQEAAKKTGRPAAMNEALPFELVRKTKKIYGLGIPIRMPRGEFAVLGVLAHDNFRCDSLLISDLYTLSHYLGLSLEHAWLVKKLKDANKHLQELDTLKDEFINNVTHELKTPLTTIKLAAQTLNSGPRKEEVREDIVKIILTEADRLNRLISNVLTVSKASSDASSFQIQAFRPRDVVAEVFDSLRLQSEERGISLELESADDTVSSDMGVIRQILTNLVSNAIKYTRPNTKVKLVLFFEPEEWTIKVMDHGDGISEENQERLFTPFFRVENAHHEVEGTGLGLYLIAKLVQKMGGLAGVQSGKTGGSCFWVILPKRLSPVAEGDGGSHA